MTNENVRFSNKGWARKAMMILVDKMIVFETVYKYAGFGDHRIGFKFTDKSGNERTIWPDGEILLDVIRTSA